MPRQDQLRVQLVKGRRFNRRSRGVRCLVIDYDYRGVGEHQVKRYLSMRNAKIEDNDSFRDLRGQATAMKAVGKIAKIAGSAVKRMGGNPARLEQFAARAEALIEQATMLSQFPDRFNARFAQRGWIAYDSLDVPVATRALELADAGDLPGAEQVLADSIDEKHLNFQLLRLGSIRAFSPRLRLAKLAATDYIEGRYHASVPIVLMLLDGFVNDLGNLGFFAEKTDLEAWDSIAAHITGLPELKKLMNTQRKTTRTEEITVPFRHGILHGNDLGYANKLVAAKCWAALFATAEWARQRERGTTAPEDRTPTPTLRESLESLAATKRAGRLLNEWKPREVGLEDPIEGTPEFVVVEFLRAWQQKNYGLMADRKSVV